MLTDEHGNTFDSRLEHAFARQLSEHGFSYITEFKLHNAGTNHRFDFLVKLPNYRAVLVEVQGGVLNKPFKTRKNFNMLWAVKCSGHNTHDGVLRDMFKTRLAAVFGYPLIHVSRECIKHEYAIETIQAMANGSTHITAPTLSSKQKNSVENLAANAAFK